MSFIVAIDGPAAAGKGTVSKAVAAHFGFAHLDTGLLYRVVGRAALASIGPSLDPERVIELSTEVKPEDLERTDLRTAAVAQAASKVAAIPEVRANLVTFQREFANRSGGAVLDGRDIGTVICPDADVKLFVTASTERRAERRFKELEERGEDTSYEGVLADVIARDKRDSERESAPLIAPEDAHLLDTSDMSIAQAVAEAIAIIDAKR
ncbi:(d)CMP kinase [Neptunicoccus cionae]|uniref:Cytidylate kinase n=1 Tax=Neptunicoccus cionae TaxID=2035344 RepID=A0A916VQ12_9RHOB|nr:(d)CMP kinase [Amylibacter cionae]GGA15679.1 cytidylate kinase [Amylibacter cionae]